MSKLLSGEGFLSYRESIREDFDLLAYFKSVKQSLLNSSELETPVLEHLTKLHYLQTNLVVLIDYVKQLIQGNSICEGNLQVIV